MSLDGSPLLYIFYNISSLSRQREFMEDILGLPVIENQFHPPHEHHGLVKYDAGPLILSLNLWVETKFQADESDGLVTVFSTDRQVEILERLRANGYALASEPGGVFTDVDGHHYIVERASAGKDTAAPTGALIVRELRLIVHDLDQSMAFYRDILGLRPVRGTDSTARYDAGGADIVLQQGASAIDDRRLRFHTYLLVFYTSDIYVMTEALKQRGLIFKSRITFTDIGGTVRFVDPSGHIFCLYQPSAESLTWGSGSKVQQITANIPASMARL